MLIFCFDISNQSFSKLTLLYTEIYIYFLFVISHLILFFLLLLFKVSHSSYDMVLMLTFRVRLKSPWSYRRRKHALLPRQWKHLFTADGKLRDGGVKFLKKVRSGVS